MRKALRQAALLVVLARHAAHEDHLHYPRIFNGLLRGTIERNTAEPRIIRTGVGGGYRL